MSLYKKICITNRKLSETSILKQIDIIAKENKPDILVLREKDLTAIEYEKLAVSVISKCNNYSIEVILHKNIETAINLGYNKIHLSFNDFMKNNDVLHNFKTIGVSVHSLDEAEISEQNGATYIILGNIFETECKKGLKGKGIQFLSDICKKVKIPVYAIGGINNKNTTSVINAGARGVCMMSGYMKLK